MLGLCICLVLGDCFGAYYESLSANPVVSDDSTRTRKQISQGFLKPSMQKFQIEMNLHTCMVWDMLPHCECCYYYHSLLLSSCPLNHAKIFVKRTSIVCLLCSSSLFDQPNRFHDLTISLLFFPFFLHHTHTFIIHSFLYQLCCHHTYFRHTYILSAGRTKTI